MSLDSDLSRPDVSENNEWDGEPLGAGPLALAILTRPAKEERAESVLSIAAASNGETRCVIVPERLGEFLSLHQGSTIVCHKAGRLFWAIANHLFQTASLVPWRSWWSVPSAFRLHDIGLLDQLLFLALHCGDPPPQNLEGLAKRYLQSPSTETNLENPGESLDQPEPPRPNLVQSLDRIVHEANLTLEIYRQQHRLALRAADHRGVRTEKVATFGPLTVGLQVQGLIALDRAARNGVQLRGNALSRWREICARAYRESSIALRQNGATRAFEWDGNQVRRQPNGLPKSRKEQLRIWLEEVSANILGLGNVPLEPPRTIDGLISTIPDYWGDLALVHPGLRSWSRLWSAASVAKALEEVEADGRLRSRYDVLPRARSREPNWEQLRRLDPGPRFEAAPNYVLLVARLPNLVLSCHAEVCERLGGQSQLGGVFRDEDDPVRFVARHLFNVNNELEDPATEEAIAWGEFDEDGALPVGVLEGWKTIARTFLHAALQGLTAVQARSLLELEHALDLSQDRAERLYWNLVNGVLPDLAYFAADATFEIIKRKLGFGTEDMEGLLLEETPETTGPALRNLITGKKQSPKTFERLRDVSRNDYWREKLAVGEGSQELFDELFTEYAVCPTGRLRKGIFFTESRAAVHLDLADDVLKASLFAVVAAGNELIACSGEEFVVEIRGDMDVEATCRSIAASANEAIRGIMKIFPPTCEVEGATVW